MRAYQKLLSLSVGLFLLGCTTIIGRIEELGSLCEDGLDNDKDGLVDCGEITCIFAPMCHCGNGFPDQGEECDYGPYNSDSSPDVCRTDCTMARCGDNVVDSPEACDDGNLENGDACDELCQIEGEASCGNGAVEDGEDCDDGNLTSGDSCDSSCQSEGP